MIKILGFIMFCEQIIVLGICFLDNLGWFAVGESCEFLFYIEFIN